MHRVQRLSDCRVLATQLEQMAVTDEGCEPVCETAMTMNDGKAMSSLLSPMSPQALVQNSSINTSKTSSGSCCCSCHDRDDFVTTTAAAGDGVGQAATGALMRSNYEAAMERIQQLEQENARLRETHVEIHQAKELYLKVLEDFPALIWRSGLDKMCDYFNRTWLEWTGKTTEQEMGIGWASGVHPDDFDECLNIYTTAFDARQAFCMEYRLTNKYGEYRWIRDYGRPFHDLDGTFLGYIGSCYDITENKNNEHHMATMHKTKDKLFDLVTHDLRHPVATCVALSEFLQENQQGLGAQELRDISLQLHHDARHTLELVDKLLQWTNQQQPQPGSGAILTSFKPQLLMSQDLFRQVLSEVNLCAKAKKIRVQAGGCLGGLDRSPRSSMDGLAGAGVHKENEEGYRQVVENVMIVADKDMILTVLRNLVMNSIKFTHPGGFIDLTAQKLDTETILLSVMDTGVGMSEEDRVKLFSEPSSRPPRRGTGNELGSGMGTVLCRDFVERHGGKIWVAESTPHHGTCIQLTLPASMAQFKQPKSDVAKRIYYKLGVV